MCIYTCIHLCLYVYTHIHTYDLDSFIGIFYMIIFPMSKQKYYRRVFKISLSDTCSLIISKELNCLILYSYL